ncbi:MAG: hypothetical protein ACLROH_08865 [Streptococcus sp.]
MKQDQDLRTILASHEAELTDMERDIAQYFIIQHDSTPVLLAAGYSMSQRQHNAFLSRIVHWLSGICLSLCEEPRQNRARADEPLQCLATLPPYQ